MQRKGLFIIVVLLLLILWYILSYEEVRNVLYYKRESIKYDRFFVQETKNSRTAFSEIRDLSPVIDRSIVFSWESLTITAQQGKQIGGTELLKIVYSGFNNLKSGDGIIFSFLTGERLMSPHIIYFEDKDLISTMPRFYGHPLIKYSPELSIITGEKKYFNSCIAYVKGFQENPELDSSCGQFVINDYKKKNLGIIIEAVSGTKFNLIKINSNT